MDIDWYDTLTAPLDAVQAGIEASDAHFRSTHEGPLTFDRIQYPAAQTYVEEFSRSSPTEWTYAVSATLYFDWSNVASYREDVAAPLASVIRESLAQLKATECITDYHPARIDFFSGEPNNDLVMAVSVRFEVTTLLDPAEF